MELTISNGNLLVLREQYHYLLDHVSVKTGIIINRNITAIDAVLDPISKTVRDGINKFKQQYPTEFDTITTIAEDCDNNTDFYNSVVNELGDIGVAYFKINDEYAEVMMMDTTVQLEVISSDAINATAVASAVSLLYSNDLLQ